jgi:hypothetical protein
MKSSNCFWNLVSTVNLGIGIWILFFGICVLTSCQPNDSKLIIGKWQSEQDWFLYKADSTYDSGKFGITMVKNFKYTIDANTHELNMYTDKQDKSFYLKYKFMGHDTLAVRNSMSSDTTWVIFERQKEN